MAGRLRSPADDTCFNGRVTSLVYYRVLVKCRLRVIDFASEG